MDERLLPSLFSLERPMDNSAKDTGMEIHQELSMMVSEYGLSAVLENFSHLASKGYLEPLEAEKLNNIATFLNFAADIAADRTEPQSD